MVVSTRNDCEIQLVSVNCCAFPLHETSEGSTECDRDRGGGGVGWGGEAGEEEVVEEEEAATVACGSDLAVQASKLTK